MPDPAIAETLAKYGPWGVAAVAMFAVGVLFKMLIAEKDRRITESRELTELALDLKRETNAALATIERLIEATSRRLR